jgi:hypothetical protein
MESVYAENTEHRTKCMEYEATFLELATTLWFGFLFFQKDRNREMFYCFFRPCSVGKIFRFLVL